MNVTVAFSPAQKGALPVVVVPCALVCFLIFKYAKRNLDETDTIGRRMEYLYSALAASLWGHVLFRILPNIPQPFPVAVGVGFFIMLCVQKCARAWRDDRYSNGSDFDGEIYHCLDRHNVQIKTTLVQENLLDDDLPRQVHRVSLEAKEISKRRKIVTLLVLTMLGTTVLEGFFLTGGETVTVVMFYVGKLLQTLAIAVALVHAFFHGMEQGRWPWYLIFSVTWCVTCGLSTLPALLDFTMGESVPALIFYALAAGIVLWVAQYFVFIDRTENNLGRTIARLVVFGVMFITTWVVSFFV